jgi:hypothetical protein
MLNTSYRNGYSLRSRTRPGQCPSALLGLLISLAWIGLPAEGAERWSVERAKEWGAEHSWLVGCNFLPSSAINQLEMWQADTFDPETIERELKWAESLGFNSVRVYLHHLAWDQNPDGFLERVDQFLEMADRHGIGVMLVPFDGVWDPHPRPGKQPDPKPHVHNSGWIQSPGAEILADPERHVEVKDYLQGVIRRFRNDRRVQVWDLFNEPDNPNRNSYGLDGTRTELPEELKEEMATALLRKLFEWAREVQPDQPLTAGVWRGDWSRHETMTEYNRVMLEESDVISFHCYDPPEEMKRRIDWLRRYDRPLLCTEYMARGNNSHFDPLLGLMKEEGVAAYNWGLVDGKSQTIYPWDTWLRQYDDRPELWFHDIFHRDGRPYRQEEVEYIRRLTGASDR